MREILFRGKCEDTGKWYTGQYINLHKTTYCFKEDYDTFKDNDIHQIVFEKMTDWGLPNQHLRVDVIPETIGQYTGLTDKNGTKIFEGDIIRYADEDEYRMYLESLECPEEYEGVSFSDLWTIDSVVYGIEMGYPAFDLNNHEWDCNGLSNLNESYQYFYEVIGNIHDNPELLGGEEK